MRSPYSPDEQRAAKPMSELLAKRTTQQTKTVAPQIHTELHQVVAQMRKDFDETAKKGVGSFGFYLGLLKNVPMFNIYRWLADIESSPSLNTPTKKAKMFWWKYKTWKTASKTPA